MKAGRSHSRPPEAVLFRRRLLLAMGLLVTATTVTALVFVRRNVAADEERMLEREFAARLGLVHGVQRLRHEVLVERSRALARKPRLQAALEDDAADLLYLSAIDEVRELLATAGGGVRPGRHLLKARFHRFLDREGRVISPQNGIAGPLGRAEERRLERRPLPQATVIDYLITASDPPGRGELVEVVTTPVVSISSGEIIAALVLGFDPVDLDGGEAGAGCFSGVWLEQRLFATGTGLSLPEALVRPLGEKLRLGRGGSGHFIVGEGRGQWLVFFQALEATSTAPPPSEICAFPLEEMVVRQRRLGWQVAGVGAGLLLAGLAGSYLLTFRLVAPVEKLARDSRRQREQRVRAESALEIKREELQRAARFSANASHQLKTPVTVMRAGLEALQAGANLSENDQAEIADLIHQTFRLSSVIEDLLLLSRLDAGQLRLASGSINLDDLVASAVDDLSVWQTGTEPTVETAVPAGLHVQGEKRYAAVILHNLLENARKYNRPSGQIRIAARTDGTWVWLRIGNTTDGGIPEAVRTHIFERFHRGGVGENIPGYGLGLNLARELARLHGGDLILLASDEGWTEFELSLRAAAGPVPEHSR